MAQMTLWTYLTTPFHFAMPVLMLKGGFAAAQYVFEPLTIQGITLATKRRAYMRDGNLLPIHDRLMVSIDISDVSFS